MIWVYILTEGQSEEKLLKTIVEPMLWQYNIFIKPFCMKTSRDQKGGAVNYDRLLKNARNILNQDKSCYLTTFFDFYKLDNTFPNYLEMQKMSDIYQKITCLEQGLKTELVNKLECRSERFIPYIQPHELEALLFSNVSVFDSVNHQWHSHIAQLQAICDNYENPEYINDGIMTAPSKRLDNILTNPKYKKTTHAPLIAEQIGLPTIETACPHFCSWLNQLRQLSVLTEN